MATKIYTATSTTRSNAGGATRGKARAAQVQAMPKGKPKKTIKKFTGLIVDK